MLPFSKRKNAGEEIELDDDDLVLVESPPPSFATPPIPRVDLGPRRGPDEPPTTARPRRVTASVSRRIIDESVAQGVAGECLSAIAAASRERQSSSRVRAAVTPPPPAPPARSAPPPPLAAPRLDGASASAPASRLPSVSPPPFVRTTSVARAPAPITLVARESSPPLPAFVRRSSSMIPIARHGAGDPGSVAPVSSERTPSPTVIVVRERPKAAWVIGAAAIGAVFAVLASRLVMTVDGPEARPAAASSSTLTSATPPVLAVPPAIVVAPAAPSVAASASASASPEVMRFGDDQGVAFKAPPRPPVAGPVTPAPVAASTSPRPRAAALGPALPDGSLSLGASPSTPARPSSPAASAPSPPPPPEKKPARVLTLEQQLAEAQLKASMK